MRTSIVTFLNAGRFPLLAQTNQTRMACDATTRHLKKAAKEHAYKNEKRLLRELEPERHLARIRSGFD